MSSGLGRSHRQLSIGQLRNELVAPPVEPASTTFLAACVTQYHQELVLRHSLVTGRADMWRQFVTCPAFAGTRVLANALIADPDISFHDFFP
jgi:hypothetical protein